MPKENGRLRDIIDEEISSIKDNITVLSANVSQNSDSIDSINWYKDRRDHRQGGP